MRLVVPINSFNDWAKLAPPKSADHWLDGRSAMELARAWCDDGGPVVPDEVAMALRSHRDLAGLRITEMTPEAKIRFDRRRGEPRNADLAGIAGDGDGISVVHVEGKADETFGDPVAKVLAEGNARRDRGESTGAPERVADLLEALIAGGAGRASIAVGSLRYQLLTATAAVLADAERRRARKAVLVVHEFVTHRTNDTLHQANAADLDTFVEAISRGAYLNLASGSAIGPIEVPGKPLLETAVPLYLVKAVRQVQRTAA